MPLRLPWKVRAVGRVSQVRFEVQSRMRRARIFLFSLPLRCRMWFSLCNARFDRYYVERRVIERQLEDIITRTKEFNDGYVYRRFCEYVKLFDKDRRGLPVQRLFKLLAQYRPNLQDQECK